MDRGVGNTLLFTDGSIALDGIATVDIIELPNMYELLATIVGVTNIVGMKVVGVKDIGVDAIDEDHKVAVDVSFMTAVVAVTVVVIEVIFSVLLVVVDALVSRDVDIAAVDTIGKYTVL